MKLADLLAINEAEIVFLLAFKQALNENERAQISSPRLAILP
jgi:hypothetical protein